MIILRKNIVFVVIIIVFLYQANKDRYIRMYLV